jgi:hypothetical protein
MLGDLRGRGDRVAGEKVQPRVQRPFHAGFVALDEFDLSAHGVLAFTCRYFGLFATKPPRWPGPDSAVRTAGRRCSLPARTATALSLSSSSSTFFGQNATQIPQPLHQSRLIRCSFSFAFAIGEHHHLPVIAHLAFTRLSMAPLNPIPELLRQLHRRSRFVGRHHFVFFGDIEDPPDSTMVGVNPFHPVGQDAGLPESLRIRRFIIRSELSNSLKSAST